tara:strand:- start:5001 stop:5348 length:348 start_codon:yes stop_codon:yes gene_type:complete
MTTLVWFLIGMISGAVFMYIGLMVANAVQDQADHRKEIRDIMDEAMQEALQQYKKMTSDTLAQYILKENFNHDIDRTNAAILKRSRKGPSPVPGGTVDEDSSTYGDHDDGSWEGR